MADKAWPETKPSDTPAQWSRHEPGSFQDYATALWQEGSKEPRISSGGI